MIAGGATALGAAAILDTPAAAAAVFDAGTIDLGAAPYNVTPGNPDPVVALANTRGINQAISEHPAGARLVLPAGDIFVRRDPDIVGIYRFAAIRIVGTDKERLELTGRGAGVTRILMTGTQDGGLTRILEVADGPKQITLCDFSIEHGPDAFNFDPNLQNHQIELNALEADVTDVAIRNVFFGSCVGDAIRLTGGESTTFLRNTTIEHVVMRLDKHGNAPSRCRSGISFQKGIRDLLLNDFHIEGPKNSCLDMEPTVANGMDNITITNGTIDNKDGDTFIAASFDGFQSGANVTSFLTHSRLVNVRIKGGQLQVVSTRGCTLDNVVIEAAANKPGATNSPLLVVFRENEDLTIRNVDLMRDTGCPAGPLVVVQNTAKSPKRINIEGGTWTTRVGPGPEAYVFAFDATGIRMRGTRIRIEDAQAAGRTAMKFRPSNVDMANVHLDGVVIESPDGLAAGFGFGAINRNLTNIVITGCTLTGAAAIAAAFTATSPFAVDRFPILQGNDFDRCTTLFSAGQAAANAVFPIIAGNRGGQCTLTGTVAPEGIVAARQGSQYLRQNGNSAELWWKAGGTGTTGWQKLA